MDKNYKEKLELAFCIEMGKLAFAEGMKCVPAHDKRIMSVISDNQSDENKVLNTCDILKAWILGWTQANLEEKVI